jgi:hypothetical protein
MVYPLTLKLTFKKPKQVIEPFEQEILSFREFCCYRPDFNGVEATVYTQAYRKSLRSQAVVILR